MTRRTPRTPALLIALCALALTALAGPAIAAAASHSVSMKVTKPYPQSGTSIKAVYSGNPFGKCNMTGTLQIPKSIQTWKCSGGSFRVTATGTSGAANDAKGTWKLSNGSGKFKGITGSGSFTGKISTGIFTYKGKASY